MEQKYQEATILVIAVTKYYRLGGLSNRHLFLTVLVAGKSKIQVLANSVSGESSLPGWKMATLLCLHKVKRRGGMERREEGGG